MCIFPCLNKAYFITLSTSEEGGEHADTSQKRRVILTHVLL